MSNLICLYGENQGDKEELASYLCTLHGYTRVALSGPVWRELSSVFSAPLTQITSPLWMERPQDRLALFHCEDPGYRQSMVRYEGHDLYEPRTSLWHLRKYANYRAATRGGAVWLDACRSSVLEAAGGVVIPDVGILADGSGVADRGMGLLASLSKRKLERISLYREELPEALERARSNAPLAHAYIPFNPADPRTTASLVLAYLKETP